VMMLSENACERTEGQRDHEAHAITTKLALHQNSEPLPGVSSSRRANPARFQPRFLQMRRRHDPEADHRVQSSKSSRIGQTPMLYMLHVAEDSMANVIEVRDSPAIRFASPPWTTCPSASNAVRSSASWARTARGQDDDGEILEGYQSPDQGRVQVLVSTQERGRAWKDRIGLVLQDSDFDPPHVTRPSNYSPASSHIPERR